MRLPSDDELPHLDAPPRPRWRLVPLILLMGFGGHVVAHALAPAAPVLGQLGLSPLAYAVLTLVPHLGQLFTPALWGWVFSVRMRLALILAPLVLVMGQSFIAIGVYQLERKHHPPWLCAPAIARGCAKAMTRGEDSA